MTFEWERPASPDAGSPALRGEWNPNPTFMRNLFGGPSPAAALLLLTAVDGHADSIAFAGFEGSDTWTGEQISGSAGVVTTTSGANDFPPLQRVLEGTHSFQTNNGTGFADFDPVDL